jgi:hypothetical protein
MGISYVVIRVIHVVTAAIWLGSAFFAGWFLMPAMRDVGPDAAKLAAAIEKRRWFVIAPIIATTTVLSGFWLYRPYMGDAGHAAALFGYGGVIGVIALALGAGVVSRSLTAATKLTTKAATMGAGAARDEALASAAKLRARGLLFARIMSVLIVLAIICMALAKNV